MNRLSLLYLSLPYLVKYLLRFIAIVVILSSAVGFHTLRLAGQAPGQWSPQAQIPGFDPETDSPLLLADQNGTVHVFSSQWLGEDSEEPVKAIMYNKWTLEEGWSTPIDILLSPHRNEARLTGAFLDSFGTVHLTFFGGEGEDAHIYYTKAPLVNAGQAPAWSTPLLVADDANDPALADLTGDDQGNLVVVYSGMRDGWGLYSIYSSDGGDTWSEPEPLFLTYAELFPVFLDLFRAQSGLIHMVWDTRTTDGQGREINFAHFDIAARQWSQPVRLAEVDSGYGVLLPTVIEQGGELVVAWSGITMSRSTDGGNTWSDGMIPFRQVGVNGAGSFVIDGNNNLHFLWAQRITANPDIHGVWHSIWQNGRWTEPEAIVSGPSIVDIVGDRAFDPTDVRAVISQGNVLLVVWRQDPGLKGNGIWYSYRVLDALELPRVAVPSQPVQPTIIPSETPTRLAPISTPTPVAVLADKWDVPPDTQNNPSMPLILGSASTCLLFFGSIALRQLFRRRRF
jgi:hypothetical protein